MPPIIPAHGRPGGNSRHRGAAAAEVRVPGAVPRLGSARTSLKGGTTMAKRGNKKRARKKKKANHGKRPNA
ncbi:hypothetical protein ABT117_21615 [Streptomyces sp. NPDC002262]|uniref:50S ribosomal protein bL37 n=1 Tax=Streptomyces sp. NPDC002262 TaxID=3154414 RepID=UPI00331D2508